jgi:hypothetical protein
LASSIYVTRSSVSGKEYSFEHLKREIVSAEDAYGWQEAVLNERLFATGTSSQGKWL